MSAVLPVQVTNGTNGAAKLFLDSLEIKGFRAFEHLRLEKLGRVNLIVGKNSVGKTCLLEAIRLYAERGSPQIVWQLLSDRNEDSSVGYQVNDESIDSPFLQVQHLFYGRVSLEEIECEIKIGALGSNRNHLELRVGVLDEQSKHATLQPFSILAEPSSLKSNSIHDIPGISIVFGSDVAQTLPLERNDFYRLSHIRLKNSSKTRSIFVSTQGVSISELDRFWDQIKLKDTKKNVLNALQAIVQEIEDVDIFGNVERTRDKVIHDRIIKVRLRGVLEPLPLQSLGEGLTRVFGLIVSLVNASNGLLLVDEIESGLHYSAQKDLWRLIFQTAEQLNVQVFATTHSWDCIEAFQVAALENENEDGMLIRLQRRNGEITPVLFDEHDLSIVTREQIEVR